MRIRSIADAYTACNTSIDSKEIEFCEKLIQYHDKSLNQLLDIFHRVYLNEKKLDAAKALNDHTVSMMSMDARYKLYRLLLCFERDIIVFEENIIRHIANNYSRYKNELPDFALLREFCRTYTYYNNTSSREKYLCTELPAKILVESGFPALNSFLICYLRPSLETEDKLSYIPDENHMYKDVQVVTSPNKALKRILLGHINTQYFIEASKFLVSDNIQLFETHTMKEASDVYEKGPRSCMRDLVHSTEKGLLNPAAVYSTEEVGIVYGIPAGSETIVGRAVFKRKTKKYVRAYGDELFINALKLNGYVEDLDAIYGCKIAFIRGEDPDCILMPYIDGPQDVYVSNDENFCTVGEIRDPNRSRTGFWFCAEGTSGIYNMATDTFDAGSPCDHCGGAGIDDAMMQVDEEMWCTYCVENDAVEIVTEAYNGRPSEYALVSAIHTATEQLPNGFEIEEGDTSLAYELGYVLDIENDWIDVEDAYEYEGEFYREEDLKRHDLIVNSYGEVSKNDVLDEDEDRDEDGGGDEEEEAA